MSFCSNLSYPFNKTHFKKADSLKALPFPTPTQRRDLSIYKQPRMYSISASSSAPPSLFFFFFFVCVCVCVCVCVVVCKLRLGKDGRVVNLDYMCLWRHPTGKGGPAHCARRDWNGRVRCFLRNNRIHDEEGEIVGERFCNLSYVRFCLVSLLTATCIVIISTRHWRQFTWSVRKTFSMGLQKRQHVQKIRIWWNNSRHLQPPQWKKQINNTVWRCAWKIKTGCLDTVLWHGCIWVCTFGEVYLPCSYSHARWSYRRRFRSLLLCFLSVERYYFFLFLDSMTNCLISVKRISKIVWHNCIRF